MATPGRHALLREVAVAGGLVVLLAGCGAQTAGSDVLVSDLETQMPWEAHPPGSAPEQPGSAATGPAAAPTTDDSAVTGGGADGDGTTDAPDAGGDPTDDPTPPDDPAPDDDSSGDPSGDSGSNETDDGADGDGSADDPDDSGTDQASGLTDLEAEVVALTGQIRADHGCATELSVDDGLIAAARGHSVDMADRDYFDHTSPDGDGPGDRAKDAGYDAWGGENIAFGYPTAEDVMDAWMDSTGHRANILNCGFVAIGVGVAEDDGSIYWTQSFGWE